MAETKEDLLRPLELEHVIGNAGKYLSNVHCHPNVENTFVCCIGANVVVGDIEDPHKQVFLKGHDEEITSLALSNSGELIASGQHGSSRSPAKDAPVIVWDLLEARQVFNLFGIREGVTALAFSPDERFLAACGQDGTMFVWDMQTGENTILKKFTPAPTFVSWGILEGSGRRPKYTLCYAQGSNVYISAVEYDVRSMKYSLGNDDPCALPSAGLKRTYPVGQVDYAGESLLCGTKAGEMAVFNVSSKIFRMAFTHAANGVHAVHPMKDGSVVVGGGDGSLKLLRGRDVSWDTMATAQLRSGVSAISASCSGKWLLAATIEGDLYRVPLSDFKPKLIEASHTSPVACVAFGAKRSDVVATASVDGRIRVWDLSDYQVLQESIAPCAVCSIWMDDEVDGSLVAACVDGQLRAFEGGSGKQQWAIKAHRGAARTITGTPAWVVSGGDDGRVCIWSRRTHELLLQFPDHVKPVTKVIKDVRKLNLLHSVGQDRSVYTYDLKLEKRIVGHSMDRKFIGNFTSLSQRKDSEEELVTSTSDGKLLFWDCDVLDGPVGAIQDPTRSRTRDCAVSPSGAFVAIVSDDQNIKIFDVKRQNLIAAMMGHSAPVVSVQWSPDEKQLVSVGEDSAVAIWNFYGFDT